MSSEIFSTIPSLSTIDEVQMAQLTMQESFTVEGQAKKARMIEEGIRHRYELERQKALRTLNIGDYPNRGDLERALDNLVQPIKFKHIDLGDGRFVLIAEKGADHFVPDTATHEDGPTRERPLYSVMVPAHYDTVPGENLSLDRHGDKWSGLGVYDMGAAVLNGMALSVETKVPEGMKVYWVFTPDEEMTSRGARLLIEKWDRFREIDCVLSSEIGPLDPMRDGERHMRVIAARSGRHKFVGNITISPNSQGHGALGNIPNASDAVIELFMRMRDRFYSGYSDPKALHLPHEPRLQKDHDALGSEQFETGVLQTVKRPGYFPPHAATFDFAIKTVPPSKIAEMEAVIKRIAKGIAKRGQWDMYGIQWDIETNPHAASYAPYSMPTGHRILGITSEIIQRVSGVAPKFVGAPSVADECDYAAAMLALRHIDSFEGTDIGISNLPINGDLAHHPGEWVSRSDTARVRHVVKLLLERPEGLSRMFAGQNLPKN